MRIMQTISGPLIIFFQLWRALWRYNTLGYPQNRKIIIIINNKAVATVEQLYENLLLFLWIWISLKSFFGDISKAFPCRDKNFVCLFDHFSFVLVSILPQRERSQQLNLLFMSCHKEREVSILIYF